MDKPLRAWDCPRGRAIVLGETDGLSRVVPRAPAEKKSAVSHSGGGDEQTGGCVLGRGRDDEVEGGACTGARECSAKDCASASRGISFGL